MRIVNGKKFYAEQIKAAIKIDGNGWDSYDGRNHQWYTLKYNKDCGLVILDANNSGDCYGDYETRYFATPAHFAAWCNNAYEYSRDWNVLLGDIDETNESAMHFVAALLPNGDGDAK